MSPAQPASPKVVIYALPGAFSLDVLGAYEVFHGAARLLALRNQPRVDNPADLTHLAGRALAYELQLVAAEAGPLETWSGTPLFAVDALQNVQGPVDTLIVAGGDVMRMLGVVHARPELRAALRDVPRARAAWCPCARARSCSRTRGS